MNDDHSYRPRWRAAVLTATAAAIGLLLAGCGGGGSAPKATSSAALGSAATGSPYQQALAYAECMRTHGAPSYPDPDSQGQFPESPQNQAEYNAPQSARTACAKYKPAGPTLTPQQEQQALAQGLKMAACLRSHGFPEVPDPSGGKYVVIPAGVDAQSAQWQAATKTCQKLTGFGKGTP